MKKIKATGKFLMIFILFALSLWVTGFQPKLLLQRASFATRFMKGMFPPDFSYAQDLWKPLLATVQMSVAGTFLGALLGLFSSFFYAANLNKNPIFRGVVKCLVQLVRTIPVLIIALLSTFLWGTGTFAGTIAILLSTWAVLTRMGGEDVAAMSLKPYRSIVNTGAGRGKAFLRTLLPEMLPGYLTNALYLLETNIRHAAILGYVGAGGIGLLLNEKIAWREYQKVGMLLLLLYLTVVLIEVGSILLRDYLNGVYTRKRWISAGIVVALLLLFLYSLLAIRPGNGSKLGWKVAGAIVKGILHPDWSYLFMWNKDGVLFLMLETICIAIAGTVLGAVFSLVITLLNSFRMMPRPIAVLVRLFVMAVRTVPVYVYGLIFIRVTGPGSFAGVLTITLCSIGLLTKRFTVALDHLDLRPFQAYKAMGIGWFARLKYCVIGPLWPQLKQAVLYRFDVNIRSAGILGLVGAGGIGAPLIIYMNNYKWNAVGAILLALFPIVLIIEKISAGLQKNKE